MLVWRPAMLCSFLILVLVSSSVVLAETTLASPGPLIAVVSLGGETNRLKSPAPLAAST